MFKHLHIIIGLFILCACHPKKELDSAIDNSYKPVEAESFQDGIEFITFNFTKDQELVQVVLEEKIEAAGTLKISNQYKRKEDSKYLIQAQSSTGKGILEFYISDPFNEHVDVFSEDGTIEGKEIVNQQKYISLRFQKPSESIIQFVVYELVNGEKFQFITLLKS